MPALSIYSRTLSIHAGWIKASLQCLQPIENLMDKLSSDHEKAKEKAEKAAKTLVQTAVRKNAATQSQNVKKRKKDAGNDAVARLELEAALAQEALDIASQNQNQEECVKAAVEKALEACKLQTHINLTVLNKTMVDEEASKTAGTAAMEVKLREAQAKVLAAKNGGGGDRGGSDQDVAAKALGLQAAIVALRRSGSLAPAVKKTNKGNKSLKEIEGEMRRFGKHLLK